MNLLFFCKKIISLERLYTIFHIYLNHHVVACCLVEPKMHDQNGQQKEEDTDALVEDLLQDFSNLSRRTVSLSRNLTTLLGKQRRIECDMTHITNSLQEARYRTEDLTTLFQRSTSNPRELRAEKRRERQKSLEKNSATSSFDSGKYSEDILLHHTESMGGKLSSKEDTEQKYLNGDKGDITDTSKELTALSQRVGFPKEVLVVSDGTISKVYRLCEVEESNIISHNKNNITSSCKVLEIHVDDPGSPLLQRSDGNYSNGPLSFTTAHRFDQHGKLLKSQPNKTIDPATHCKDEDEKVVLNGGSSNGFINGSHSSVNGSGAVSCVPNGVGSCSADDVEGCATTVDVKEKFLFLLEEEEEAYERLKEELKEDINFPDLIAPLKETS